MVAVGDKVLYAPDVAHYLDICNGGQYAWVCGWREHPNSDVEEMTNEEMAEAIKHLYKRPKDKIKLVPLRPAVLWNAAVRAVNGDGTLNLDIDYCLPGVVHSYDKVPPGAANEPLVGGTWRLP